MGRPPLDPDDEPARITITAPKAWAKRLDAWRRQQEDLPNLSEAIRRLVDAGLEVGKKGKKR